MSTTVAGRGKQADVGVAFPQGTSGSALFARLLEETIAAFPAAFGGLRVARGKEFRATYGELVTQFEERRARAENRTEIALHLARRQLESFVFESETGSRPLLEAFAEKAEPLALTTGTGEPSRDAVIAVPYLGTIHRADELATLGSEFVARHTSTVAAARALSWIGARAEKSGALDLREERFAVLGAAAEIAPTQQLIHTGARVLWIDVQEPPPALRLANVSWVAGGADLLASPVRIARTIDAFADGHPLRIGAYAYAPGRGREWRLAVAMNAIAHRIDPTHAASLSMLLSPTTPAVAQPEDLAARLLRISQAKLWQRGLVNAGWLTEAHVGSGDSTVVRAVVAAQGPTYQAAQYLAKRIFSEALAGHGSALAATAVGSAAAHRPLVVSANVAPITRTRSLQHPVFEAGFLGAPRFGVEIFDPQTTRALGAMMMLHDLLNEASPAATSRTPAQAAALYQQQIHGGIFGMPWALDRAIGAAAAIGFAQRPRLLARMLR